MAVLYSVPIGDRRADVDHVLIGPPGVVTINTKHHRAGRLSLDDDDLVVNGRSTAYVRKARREARWAAELLRAALSDAGKPDLAVRLRVRSVIAVVGGRLVITRWASGVTVVMTRQLIHALQSMPATLDPDEVRTVYGLARRSTTWNHGPHGGRRDSGPTRP